MLSLFPELILHCLTSILYIHYCGSTFWINYLAAIICILIYLLIILLFIAITFIAYASLMLNESEKLLS